MIVKEVYFNSINNQLKVLYYSIILNVKKTYTVRTRFRHNASISRCSSGDIHFPLCVVWSVDEGRDVSMS